MQLANARRIRDKYFRIIGIVREGSDVTSYIQDHRYIDFRDDRMYDNQLKQLASSLWGQRRKPRLRNNP